MLQANGSSRYARLAELKADALSLDRDTLVNVVLELVMVPEETFVGADRIQVAHDAIVRERRQLENLKHAGAFVIRIITLRGELKPKQLTVG
jgi:hypothetical protein